MSEEKTATRHLKELPPDRIRRNPDNPRLFFRPDEMDTLMASIRRYGIQVPISVYEEGAHYVLIDGERRWRAARKLNIRTIPAIVQPRPTPLDNLLLMFNIHALREQWDYLTIADKLPSVIALFRDKKGKEPTEEELSEITGLTRGQIRRCKLLVDLPKKYKTMLQEELSLPKPLQKLSEDLFIEMERALKTVRARVPSAVRHLDSARDALIRKFQKGTGSGQSARSTSSYFRLVDACAIATTHEAIFGHSRPARTLPIITKTAGADFDCEADVCIIHGLIASGAKSVKRA